MISYSLIWMSSCSLFTCFPVVNCGSCRLPIRKTLHVKEGDEIRLQFSIFNDSAYSGEELLWKDSHGKELGRCFATRTYNSSSYYGGMKCESYPNNGFCIDMEENCVTNCVINLELRNAGLDYSGNYVMESVEDECIHLKVKIYVLARPICTALLQEDSDYLQMSCEWAPRNDDDILQFLVENHTLFEYHGKEINKSNTIIEKSIVSTMIRIDEATCDNNIPDICRVFQMGMQMSCRFFLQNNELKVKDADFYNFSLPYCSSGNTSSHPKLLLYDRQTWTNVNSTEQSFQINLSRLRSGRCDESGIIILCGEEKSGGLGVNIIVKLVADKQLFLDIMFRMDLTSDSYIGESKPKHGRDCANKYVIDVEAFLAGGSVNRLVTEDFTATRTDRVDDGTWHESSLHYSILVISLLALLFCIGTCITIRHRLIPTTRTQYTRLKETSHSVEVFQSDVTTTRDMDNNVSLEMTTFSTISDESQGQDIFRSSRSHDCLQPAHSTLPPGLGAGNLTTHGCNQDELKIDNTNADYSRGEERQNYFSDVDESRNDDRQYSREHGAGPATKDNVYCSVDEIVTKSCGGDMTNEYNSSDLPDCHTHVLASPFEPLILPLQDQLQLKDPSRDGACESPVTPSCDLWNANTGDHGTCTDNLYAIPHNVKPGKNSCANETYEIASCLSPCDPNNVNASLVFDDISNEGSTCLVSVYRNSKGNGDSARYLSPTYGCPNEVRSTCTDLYNSEIDSKFSSGFPYSTSSGVSKYAVTTSTAEKGDTTRRLNSSSSSSVYDNLRRPDIEGILQLEQETLPSIS